MKTPTEFFMTTFNEGISHGVKKACQTRATIDAFGCSFAVAEVESKTGYPTTARLVQASEPAIPAWTGEGLPPVGTVCEVKGCMSHYLQWNKVTVFAVRGKTVFFDMEDGRWGQTASHEFRPIRTPEQIAAEEREAIAADLFRSVMKSPKSCPWSGLDEERREHYRSLIDQGWQKVPRA